MEKRIPQKYVFDSPRTSSRTSSTIPEIYICDCDDFTISDVSSNSSNGHVDRDIKLKVFFIRCVVAN